MKTTVTVKFFDENDEEVEAELPACMEVCDDCEGHGYVMNESMRSHAYTREEFEETFHDEEDRAQYFKRGGIYDVQCPTCKGRNVVPVVDASKLNGAVEVEQYNQHLAYQKIMAREEAAERHEREMGY